MIKNMPEKTGKSLEQWFKVIKAKGLSDHKEIMALLKKEGVSYGFANSISIWYRQEAAGGPSSDDELVDAQYKGKEALRPLYEKIRKAAAALGKDVTFAPKQANVSMRRKKQFGVIQPSTKDRMDLGLILRKTPAKGRLETWGGMCTHKIKLNSAADFDKEVIAWMKKAYEEAG
jgi:hypothetical protein